MPLKRSSERPHRRAGRPAQRGEVNPLQPHHRLPPRDRHRRWPGRPATRMPSPPSGRARPSPWSTPAGCSAPATIRCTSWSSTRAARRCGSADVMVFVVDGREGLVPGRRGDRRRRCGRSTAPVIIAVNKTDDKRARGRRVEFYGWGSSRWSRSPPSTARASATCSTRSSRCCPARARVAAAGADARRNRRRHRRPAERRQVVAAQSVAARGARRSSATCRGRRATPSTRC